MKLMQVAGAVSLGRAVNRMASNSGLRATCNTKVLRAPKGLAEAVHQTGTRVCGLFMGKVSYT
jgi:hypothetical protein